MISDEETTIFYSDDLESINEFKIVLDSEKELELKISDLITIGVAVSAFVGLDPSYQSLMNDAARIVAAHQVNQYVPYAGKLLKEISIAFNNRMLRESEDNKNTIKFLKKRFRKIKNELTGKSSDDFLESYMIRLV